MSIKCASCGRFLAFADMMFTRCDYEPLSEFGPERIEFVGPCCRYREEAAKAIEAGTAKTEGLGPKDESAVRDSEFAQKDSRRSR